jgi:hypothetical protein
MHLTVGPFLLPSHTFLLLEFKGAYNYQKQFTWDKYFNNSKSILEIGSFTPVAYSFGWEYKLRSSLSTHTKKNQHIMLWLSGRCYPAAVSVTTTHRDPGQAFTSPKDRSVAAHVVGNEKTVTHIFLIEARGGTKERKIFWEKSNNVFLLPIALIYWLQELKWMTL